MSTFDRDESTNDGFNSILNSMESQPLKSAREGLKYQCIECGKQLSSAWKLNNHKRAIHEGIKYNCELCKHQSTTKGNLARHKRAVNEGIKHPVKNVNFEQKQIKSYQAQKRSS